MTDKRLQLVRGERSAFGLHGRSAEQRVALDILLDPEIGIVSLGGRAGTGKSALALCAGLEAVLERRLHKKIVVFRPLYPVGGQELGYLPGTEGEKMSPWAQAVFDTLGALVSNQVIEEIMDRGLIEVLPLTHIRGRSLHDAFVIVDEAQNLTLSELITVITRIGKYSKFYILGDPMQTDLKNKDSSGFKPLFNLFNNPESKEQGIFCEEFGKEDIMRSEILKFIVAKLETIEKKH